MFEFTGRGVMFSKYETNGWRVRGFHIVVAVKFIGTRKQIKLSNACESSVKYKWPTLFRGIFSG